MIGINEFTCAECGGTFEKGRTDEEALSELKIKFPGHNPEDCEIICDDCWKSLGFDQ